MPIARQGCLSLVFLLTAQLASAQTPQANRCSLFTTAEIATLLGTSVEGGEAAALGTGCQWFGKDEESYVIIQVLDTTYWLDPRQAPGYEAMEGAGKRAYSHPEEGGWRAMAVTNQVVAAAVLSGVTAKRTSIVALLRQLLERL